MNLRAAFRTLLRTETKSGIVAPEAWLTEMLGATPATAGIAVTPRSAMECAPVRAAVQAISEAIGQLPVHVYRRTDGGKARDHEHPLSALLNDRANDWTAASDFREAITRDALLYPGGGFAFINRVDGKVAELIRLDPETTPVTVSYENSEPQYTLPQKTGPARVIPRANILHIPSPSLGGRGLVREGREAIALAIAMERHAARLFANGARPSGILSLKKNSSLDATAKVKAAWQAAHGGDKSGGTAIIPDDAEWQPITLTSVDAQFLELRKFAIEEIARIFRVPPHMLFELGRATWSNAEQMRDDFLSLCLMAWIKRWEGEIRLKLLSEDDRATHVVEFFTNDFARANLATRMESYAKAIAARIINPNEARGSENMPPYDGGDKFENPNTSRGEAT